MIFFVIAPFGLGLANYLVPLQIGAPDMAFPRLNATSLWLFVFGGLTVFCGVAAYGGAAATGWTSYAPLSEIVQGTGAGQDLWFVGSSVGERFDDLDGDQLARHDLPVSRARHDDVADSDLHMGDRRDGAA